MATIAETYQRYIAKVEKNATNDALSTDKQRFVFLFNEAQNKFLENLLDRRGEDDIRYIQNFLVLNKNLSSSTKYPDRYSFKLPLDYLDLSNAQAIAKKGECSDKIYLFEIKDENKNEILQDPFNKPSFKWRESCYTINSDTISIYYDDFLIEKALLSYYRYPKRISQVNPSDPESKFNETSIIEWDDKALDRIISLMTANFLVSEQNPAFQIQKQQVINKQ